MLTLAADDFLRMPTGNAPVAAMFVAGRLRVKGEYVRALRLPGYFDIPRAV
jgi:hypothetical protein